MKVGNEHLVRTKNRRTFLMNSYSGDFTHDNRKWYKVEVCRHTRRGAMRIRVWESARIEFKVAWVHSDRYFTDEGRLLACEQFLHQALGRRRLVGYQHKGKK